MDISIQIYRMSDLCPQQWKTDLGNGRFTDQRLEGYTVFDQSPYKYTYFPLRGPTANPVS